MPSALSYMYVDGSPHQRHHIDTYGPLDRFGYKDFIPRFTAPKFDPDEWAELFRAAGARFAGPVGEHHDGSSLWATDQTEWHAGRLGPKRDVVAALERSIRAAGLRSLLDLLACYYNRSVDWGREVAVTYKHHHLVPGAPWSTWSWDASPA